jgi:hypothetical protein
VNLDLRFAATSIQNDADDVKAAGWRYSTGNPPNISPGNRQNVLPLIPIDRRQRWCKPHVGSGLHLNEAESTAVPANQVNLTSIIRNTKVCGNDYVTQAPQVQVGLELAAFAGQQMFRFARWHVTLTSSRLRMTNLVSHTMTRKKTSDQPDCSGFRFPTV